MRNAFQICSISTTLTGGSSACSGSFISYSTAEAVVVLEAERPGSVCMILECCSTEVAESPACTHKGSRES